MAGTSFVGVPGALSEALGIRPVVSSRDWKNYLAHLNAV